MGYSRSPDPLSPSLLRVRPDLKDGAGGHQLLHGLPCALVQSDGVDERLVLLVGPLPLVVSNAALSVIPTMDRGVVLVVVRYMCVHRSEKRIAEAVQSLLLLLLLLLQISFGEAMPLGGGSKKKEALRRMSVLSPTSSSSALPSRKTFRRRLPIRGGGASRQ